MPFGNDEFAVFGSDFALPVVGNFDPHRHPSLPLGGVVYGLTNLNDPDDVNGDGLVGPVDVLTIINDLNVAKVPGATAAGRAERPVLGCERRWLDHGGRRPGGDQPSESASAAVRREAGDGSLETRTCCRSADTRANWPLLP